MDCVGCDACLVTGNAVNAWVTPVLHSRESRVCLQCVDLEHHLFLYKISILLLCVFGYLGLRHKNSGGSWYISMAKKLSFNNNIYYVQSNKNKHTRTVPRRPNNCYCKFGDWATILNIMKSQKSGNQDLKKVSCEIVITLKAYNSQKHSAI